MRQKLMVATVVLAVVSSASFAADPSAKKAVDQPAPSLAGVNWAGVYVGGNAGYAWTNSNFTHLEDGAANGERFSNSPNKFLGGVQIGSRYQIQNNLIVGAELAYSSRSANGMTRTNLDDNPRNRISEVGNIWSVSGTVGRSFDRYLGYVKAGYASTELRYSNNSIPENTVLGRSKGNVNGYVIGGGLEYALTSKVSVAAEYNYYKFNVGNQTQLTTTGALAGAINARNDLSSHTAVVKLNYKF